MKIEKLTPEQEALIPIVRDEWLTLGLLTVAKGKTAYLAHPQHGYAGIAPGSYELRRQREQADEIRRIKD